MKRLCFASVFAVLLQATKNGKKKDLYISLEKIVDLDDKFGDPYTDQSPITRRSKAQEEFPDNITKAFLTANPLQISIGFQKYVICKFDKSKLVALVLAIKDIIENDNTIKPDSVIGSDQQCTKEVILRSNKFFLPDFITNVFLYAITITNKDCKPHIAEVLKSEYLNGFMGRDEEITLISELHSIPTALNLTVNERTFDETFKAISLSTNLDIPNPSVFKFYQLNIANKQIQLSDITSFIRGSISKYVFSREEYRIRKEDDAYALDALEILNNAYSLEDKVTAFSEIMVYAFLEGVLKAPKIMSSIELKNNAGITSSKASSIHLLSNPTLPHSNQLVFGTAATKCTIVDAVKSVFEQITQIISNRKAEQQIIDRCILNSSFDPNTTAFIKNILKPNKYSNLTYDASFGIFIGYSIDTSEKANYSIDEFPKYIMKNIELDIQFSAHKIAYAIKNTILENYSFYIYILPFEQAEKDSIKIMDDATSVGRQS